MKTTQIFLFALFGYVSAWTQTNTFPSSGNVGIGTTNPQHGKLQIFGNGPTEGINLWTNSGETTSRIWIDTQLRTFHLTKGADPTRGITIGNFGLVGIGTAAPSSILHVSTGTSGDAVFRLEADTDNNNENDNPIIELRQDGDIIGANIGFSENFGENKFGIGTRYTGTTGDQWDAFIVDVYTGNIGMGTQDPGTYRLAVNGNVRAKEVRVETGWSDFVFEKDYDLPTLEEVEGHIKAKGHLKDIPSAEEVAENGILLGEMDSKLLLKIEELTLYIIDINKRTERLERENTKLKRELAKLK